MTPEQKISRLESLLARVQQRATEPRGAKPGPRPQRVSFQPPTEGLPEMFAHAVVSAPISAPAALPAPPIPPAPEPRAYEPPAVAPMHDRMLEGTPLPIDVQPMAAAETSEGPSIEVSHADAVSGEFEVAEMALELEELGPADEDHDEPVVEIEVEEEPHLEARHAESEPPASGRELVAAPHESARVAVAAPLVEQEHGLDLHEESPAPPESARNLRAAPAIPLTSEVVPLAPAFVREERERVEEAPVAEPVIEAAPEPVIEATPEPVIEATPEPVIEATPEPVIEATPEPVIEAAPEPAPEPLELDEEPDSEPPATQFTHVPEIPSREMREAAAGEAADIAAAESLVAEPFVAPLAFSPVDVAPLPAVEAAVAVVLAAPAAHARTIEQTVSVEAAVIVPKLTPLEVASFVSAVRTFKPESFGVLLDAALDL